MVAFLAGDIGGTSTRLALYERSGESFHCSHQARFKSQEYLSLTPVIESFLSANSSHPKPLAACFGVPGPVNNGIVSTTNLPWNLSESELSETLSIPHVKLVNDLGAVAAVVPHLHQDDLAILHSGNNQQNNSTVWAVVAPGTGLGQSMVAKQPDGIRVFSSEGGHVNFAPTSPLEWELFQYLLKTLKRVSVERLCSGPGIYNIFAFLRDTGRERVKSAVWERTQRHSAPQVIAEAAINGECAMCEHTMEIFARILGSHAGNVLLTYLATGGIFIGGGIAPKVIKFLERSAVTASYLAKGRLSPIVEATPLVVIRDERAGLTGAARIAASLMGNEQQIYF